MTDLVIDMGASYVMLVFGTAVIFCLLGMILDPLGILLITLPILIPVFKQADIDLIWMGIILIKYIEIGLLTPPLGMACFVIKGCLEDERITLGDVFLGAAPFAVMIVFILVLLTVWPDLVYINRWID